MCVCFNTALSHYILTGRLTGNPDGGEVGRAVLRDWQASIAAKPQPLGSRERQVLCDTYVRNYKQIGIVKTEKQATQAIKNYKKKTSRQITVRSRLLRYWRFFRLFRSFCHFSSFQYLTHHSTGCNHEAQT